VNNTVEDRKGDFVTDADSIFGRLRNHLCELLKVHGISDFRMTRAAEPSVN